MATSTQTGNYGLSQYAADDPPKLLTNYNQDMAKIDTAIKAAKDKADNASNPNLLINGDFQIWQRGDTFDIADGNNTYTADRWRVNADTTISKVATGLQTSAACTIEQVLEDLDYAKINGKTVTLSKSINGVVTSDTFTATSATISISLVANDTLNWVKLEVGSVATPFSPRPYAEELALCQRYCRDLCGIYNIIQYTNDDLSFRVNFNDIRIIPTLVNIGTENTDWEVESRTDAPQSGFTLSELTAVAIHVLKTSHGLTDAILRIENKGKVLADAEIY